MNRTIFFAAAIIFDFWICHQVNLKETTALQNREQSRGDGF